LGHAYAHALASRGAKVVVNDLGDSGDGDEGGPPLATVVAEEIRRDGGEAVPVSANVVDEHAAESIVEAAIDNFGRVDVVVNNAGNIEPEEMPALRTRNLVSHLDVHVSGALNVSRAAWPYMVEQGYGRLILTTSIGLLGLPYMPSYATAKGAVFSLGRSLSLSGAEAGIKVNLLAPAANTRMVLDPKLREESGLQPLDEKQSRSVERSPAGATPMLLILAHESCPVSGETLVAGLGRFARLFAAETRGIVEHGAGPEDLLRRWDEIVDETGYLVHGGSADSASFRERLIEEHDGS
jgi:NAD(P)-dependent dehydrogenase (short-subunit alcohol dehydrogenase family)